jgi:hypothetical protein
METNEYSVFLVSGRDKIARNYLVFVFTSFGMRIITWENALEASGGKGKLPTTLDVVSKGLELADAIVVLSTPDEYASCRRKFRKHKENAIERQPRLNVILEAGMAIALANNKDKKVAFIMSNTRELSDIAGLQYGIQPLEKVRNDLKSKNLPNFESNSFYFDKQIEIDSPIIALKVRGTPAYYIDKIRGADKVCLLGASLRNILQDIIDHPSYYKNKGIHILLPANETIAGNFDILERHPGRNLLEEIAEHCEAISNIKNGEQGNLKNLIIKRFHHYNSSTIYIIGKMMWITPYTHLEGDFSPTYIISREECPDVFKHYQGYFDYLWGQ